MTFVLIFELSCALDTRSRFPKRVAATRHKVAVTDAVLFLVVLENCTYVYTCVVYSSDPKLIQCVTKIQNT
jgi:hypothetical protein